MGADQGFSDESQPKGGALKRKISAQQDPKNDKRVNMGKVSEAFYDVDIFAKNFKLRDNIEYTQRKINEITLLIIKSLTATRSVMSPSLTSAALPGDSEHRMLSAIPLSCVSYVLPKKPTTAEGARIQNHVLSRKMVMMKKDIEFLYCQAKEVAALQKQIEVSQRRDVPSIFAQKATSSDSEEAMGSSESRQKKGSGAFKTR